MDWREILEQRTRWDGGREMKPTPIAHVAKPRTDYRPQPRIPILHTLICSECKETFQSKRRDTSYCSKRCRVTKRIRLRSIERARIAEQRRKALIPGMMEMRRERLAEHLANVRPRGEGSIGKREQRYSKMCLCGTPFLTAYENAKWHSATCRKYYQRHPELLTTTNRSQKCDQGGG